MNFIKFYIDALTKNDIITFIKKNNYLVSDQEVDIIYTYIKNNYQSFLNNPEKELVYLKTLLSTNTYNIVLELYNKYKKGL